MLVFHHMSFLHLLCANQSSICHFFPMRIDKFNKYYYPGHKRKIRNEYKFFIMFSRYNDSLSHFNEANKKVTENKMSICLGDDCLSSQVAKQLNTITCYIKLREPTSLLNPWYVINYKKKNFI